MNYHYILVSHVIPEKPTGHVQVKDVVPTFVQAAPFLHGDDAQGVVAFSKNQNK